MISKWRAWKPIKCIYAWIRNLIGCKMRQSSGGWLVSSLEGKRWSKMWVSCLLDDSLAVVDCWAGIEAPDWPRDLKIDWILGLHLSRDQNHNLKLAHVCYMCINGEASVIVCFLFVFFYTGIVMAWRPWMHFRKWAIIGSNMANTAVRSPWVRARACKRALELSKE